MFDAIKSKLSGMLGGSKGEEDTDPIEEKAETWLNGRWNDLKEAYLIYHMSVWEALLFYVGQSWIAWDENRKIWYPNTPTDEWVPRPKINRFSPTIDSITANFNDIPQVEATPKSDLNGNIDVHGICEIASALAEHFLIDNGLRGDYKGNEDVAGTAAQIFVLAGSLFTYTYPEVDDTFDTPQMGPQGIFEFHCGVCDLVEETSDPVAECPHCGNVDPATFQVTPVERMKPMMGPDGQPQMSQNNRYKICCEVRNPLYALPRAGATGMKDIQYLLWGQRRTLDWVYFNCNGFEAEADNEYLDQYSITFEHALNYFYTGYSSASLQSKDACMVKEAFIEPKQVKEFPDGLYVRMVNGKVVESSTWREKFVEHPLTFGSYLQIPTLFFGRSVSFDLVEIQREKQGYDSLIKLHGMTSAVDSVIVDENTIVSEITGRADKIIKWRSIGPGSAAPHRMQHGTLDDGIYKTRADLNSEFDNISGAVAVYRGRQPGSITAGKAIDELKGQAEQTFTKPTLNWNALWRETVRKGVKMMQQYLTHDQIAEMVGPDRLTQIDSFKKADLDKLVDWAATDMGQPKTRAQRKSEFQELFDRGALDMNDPNVKQQLFELFGHTGMLSMFNADATRARWENKQMMRGIQIDPKPEIEDLATHYAIHVESIKNLDFERWPQQGKQLLMQHTIETKQILEMQAAAAPPPPAKPGEKGGGPPPPKKPEPGAKPEPPHGTTNPGGIQA